MTLADALTLRVGEHVIHPRTPVPYKPIRVTEVWVNTKQTIVNVRLASISPTSWLDATGYELPPENKIWDDNYRDWVTRDVFKARRAVAPKDRAPSPVTAPSYEDDDE